MTCNYNPLRGLGASKASLLDTLGLGNIWDWLRDFLHGVFFRNELYDDKNHPYLGMGRDYGAANDIVDGAAASKLAVPDIATDEPDAQPPQDDPGITMFISSYQEFSVDSDGLFAPLHTHQEIIIKSVINGVTRYGRIPLFGTYPTEGVLVGNDASGDFPPSTPAIPTWNPANPQEAITALGGGVASVYGLLQDLKSQLQREGVLRGWTTGLYTPG